MKALMVSVALLGMAGIAQAAESVVGVYKQDGYVATKLELKADHRFSFEILGSGIKGEASGLWEKADGGVTLTTDPFPPVFRLLETKADSEHWVVEFVQPDGQAMPGKPSLRSALGMNGLGAALVHNNGQVLTMGNGDIGPWQVSWPREGVLKQVVVANALNVFQAPTFIPAQPGQSRYRIAVDIASAYKIPFNKSLVSVSPDRAELITPESGYKLNLSKETD